MAHWEVEGVSKVKVQTAKTCTDADKQYDDFWTEASENMEAVYPASWLEQQTATAGCNSMAAEVVCTIQI